MAWFAGQLGHIEKGRGLREMELFPELPGLFKVPRVSVPQARHYSHFPFVFELFKLDFLSFPIFLEMVVFFILGSGVFQT